MKKSLFVWLLFVFVSESYAQQVMLQGWYWDYPKTARGFSWADTLRLKAPQLGQSGFTHLWFPPHAVASFGPNSNGYDPQDLFIGNQTTGLGTRPALDAMLSALRQNGVQPVADMVYNHRDGGRGEANPAVRNYVYTLYQDQNGDNPFPSDRFRYALPLGSLNGAGDYYFKISSKTGSGRFFGKPYRVYAQTNRVGYKNLPNLTENEPNGGGDCGQGNTPVPLGVNLDASVDAGTGCRTDEFKITLTADDFFAAGDTLYVYTANLNGDYSDHRVYGLWSGSRRQDIGGELILQTYTNFNGLPSGRGGMSYDNFRPNNGNPAGGGLRGDQDGMYFFYDYDQNNPATRDTLFAWTRWNMQTLGVQGLRMDAIKHFPARFVSGLLNHLYANNLKPSLVVGEWYGTNAAELKGWVDAVSAGMTPAARAAIPPKIFDFSLRENLRKACNEPGFDVRNIYLGSLRDAAGMSGFNVVTFLNNHDFRTADPNAFDALTQAHVPLAYAYLLTNNQLGVPTVFYPDYYGYVQGALPGSDGQPLYTYPYHPTGLRAYRAEIDQLIGILQTYVQGATGVDYLNKSGSGYAGTWAGGQAAKTLFYQLNGAASVSGRDVVVAINFDSSPLRLTHQIALRNGIAEGTVFTDVSGKSTNAGHRATVSGGQLSVSLPPDSYAVFVQGDICAEGQPLQSLRSGDWNDPATWACGRVPAVTDAVMINSPHTVTVSVPAAQARTLTTLGHLVIAAGGHLQLQP